jgi:aryl-alcohol dehydrogenase-like predicted oxidoreductase
MNPLPPSPPAAPAGAGTCVLGLAALHHLRTPAARQRYLALALDLGVRHFDTAPLYGNGLSEVELGLALAGAGARERVSIATKFGFRVWMYGERSRALFLPLRIADRLLPGYRARLEARDYSAAALRASVQASLRRLRTDRIDLLFVHEPPPSLVLDDALLSEMDRLRRAGQVLAFGIAGEHAAALGAATAPVSVLQGPIAAMVQPGIRAGIRRRAYFLHEAYRRDPLGTDSYPAFLARMRHHHPDIDLLVATRSMDRLRGFGPLFR